MALNVAYLLNATYNLQRLTETASVHMVQCNVLRRWSSRRISTTGLDVVSRWTGSLAKRFVSISTWYLQHGSNCHDAVYRPVHSSDTRPRGVYK